MSMQPVNASVGTPQPDLISGSVDAALKYALDTLGHRGTAKVLRAAAFSEGIEDAKNLRPQLASAILKAVERHHASRSGDGEA